MILRDVIFEAEIIEKRLLPIVQALGAAKGNNLPIMIVVMNNRKYAAMQKGHVFHYPDGVASVSAAGGLIRRHESPVLEGPCRCRRNGRMTPTRTEGA